MRLAAFTDEIDSGDLQRALDLAVAWGLSAVEMRGLPTGRLPKASDEELRLAGQRIADAGLTVSGLSPGLFKSPAEAESMATDLNERLPRMCEWAQRWGTDRISVFASSRAGVAPGQGEVPAIVVDHLGRMADVATAAQCRLTLENVGSCWGDTGTQAAQIVRAVGHERLGLCWDPGNAARSRVTDPVGEYAGLADLVEYVHVKNAIADDWALVDAGVVDWGQQLRALHADGYDGWLVIETHLRQLPEGAQAIEQDGVALPPLASNTLHNLRTLRRLLGHE